jgi:hypothetical protein
VVVASRVAARRRFQRPRFAPRVTRRPAPVSQRLQHEVARVTDRVERGHPNWRRTDVAVALALNLAMSERVTLKPP